MTYVIAEPCIGSKDASCVDVCPVDCIHPTPQEPRHAEAEMLFIHPDECIDCGVCAEACPADAPYAQADLPRDWLRIAEVNARYYVGPR